MTEERHKAQPGDLVYWDGLNPNGTQEAPCYYIVLNEKDSRMGDPCLVDGNHNYFLPTTAYSGHLKITPREAVDETLVRSLPTIIQQYFDKYKEESQP